MSLKQWYELVQGTAFPPTRSKHSAAMEILRWQTCLLIFWVTLLNGCLLFLANQIGLLYLGYVANVGCLWGGAVREADSVIGVNAGIFLLGQ